VYKTPWIKMRGETVKLVILFVLILMIAVIATYFGFYVNAISRLHSFNCILTIAFHEAETCSYICKIKKILYY